MKIKLKVSHFIIIVAALLLGGALFAFFQYNTNAVALEHAQHAPEIVAKFEDIIRNANSACYGISTVRAMSDESRIKGSCCGPMYLHTYAEQIESVKKYSYIDKIPTDPYDIPVSQAKKLIDDFYSIKLSTEQQQVYEEAKKLSHEGGPCCCGDDFSETSCWRWKVYGGLAKYLITDYDFGAQQIAEVWDISDGCGGDHHIESVHA